MIEYSLDTLATSFVNHVETVASSPGLETLKQSLVAQATRALAAARLVLVTSAEEDAGVALKNARSACQSAVQRTYDILMTTSPASTDELMLAIGTMDKFVALATDLSAAVQLEADRRDCAEALRLRREEARANLTAIQLGTVAVADPQGPVTV